MELIIMQKSIERAIAIMDDMRVFKIQSMVIMSLAQ